MANQTTVVQRARQESILATNSVIRNTYILLALSLTFSAAMAAFAMIINAPPLGFITFIGYFGLLFFIQAFRNSALGIVGVFALTGFMGFTLGPMLNAYIHTFTNGYQMIMTALGGTGAIFFGLSSYALTTKKDFSYMAGFLAAGAMVLLFAIVIQIFFPMPMLQLAMSAAFVLFSSAIILFETSQIIHGGERNYVMATVSLFIALYNLFISLLHILSVFSGNRD